jgi:hypothetical protein
VPTETQQRSASGRHRRPLPGGRLRRVAGRLWRCLFGGYRRPAVLVPTLLVILALLGVIAVTLSVYNAVLVLVVGIGLRCYCAAPARS